MRILILILILIFLPSFALAEDPQIKALTKAYEREVTDLEAKYKAALDRMEGLLLAEEQKRRSDLVVKLLSLQEKSIDERSLEVAIQARNKAKEIQGLAYEGVKPTPEPEPARKKTVTAEDITGKIFTVLHGEAELPNKVGMGQWKSFVVRCNPDFTVTQLDGTVFDKLVMYWGMKDGTITIYTDKRIARYVFPLSESPVGYQGSYWLERYPHIIRFKP